MKLKADVITITPTMAAKWLEGNTHNRPLSQRTIENYAQAMLRGDWSLNGESIIFSDDGKLMDGQHRLWACIESKVNFEAVVVFGTTPETFSTIDQGKLRTSGDVLHVAGVGEGNLSTVAAAATLVIRYRRNDLFSTSKVSSKEIVKFVQKEPEITHWVQEARRAPRGFRGFATAVATTMHIGGVRERAKADEFMDKWVGGAGLPNGSPILTLRQRVLQAPPRVSWHRLFIVVSAWNAFTQDRLMLKMGSIRGDKFPRIEGEIFSST